MVGVDLWKFIKTKTQYLPLLLILIPIFLSFSIRTQSSDLDATDTWARNFMYANLEKEIEKRITAQYPNVPEATLKAHLADELEKTLQEGIIYMGGQPVVIEDLIREQSEYYKQQFKDDLGQTYLVAIDPYYYYRLTKNYLDHGFEQDIILENPEYGEYCDLHTVAGEPLDKKHCGGDKVSNLHTYVNAYTYKIMHFFNRNISIMAAVFYVPVIIATLAVIPAFFIGRRIAGDLAGFIAAIIVAVHHGSVVRTIAGFSDTDAYSVLFPLLIVWGFIEAINAKTWKGSVLYSSLAGLGVGLYSFAWSGWFFVFDFILIASFAYIFFLIAKEWRKIFDRDWSFLKGKSLKTMSGTLCSFFVSSAIFVSLASSFFVFLGFFSVAVSTTQLKVVGLTKIWPNVYTTVAELHPATLAYILPNISISNKVILLASFIGLLLVTFKSKKDVGLKAMFTIISLVWYIYLMSATTLLEGGHLIYTILLAVPIALWSLYAIYKNREINSFYSFLLMAWFAITIYAGGTGVRFIILLVPAFALSVGITMGLVYRNLSGWIIEGFKTNKIITNFAVAIVLSFFLLWPVNIIQAGYQSGSDKIPSMNDQWYGALKKIDDEAAPDAIVNSWWDFGHWFAAIADRPVTLDGGRQNNPAAHWLGKLMLTSDEKEAVGILHYLDCGNYYGFTYLDEYNQDELKTINEITEILKMECEDAIEYLISRNIPLETAEKLMEYTHCAPPENYFITSEDMVGKAGVWAHFGAWNFTKASMYRTVHKVSQDEGVRTLNEEFGVELSEALNLYNTIQDVNADDWIAPWPAFRSRGAGVRTNDTLMCDNGLSFNFAEKEAYLMIEGQKVRPSKVSFINNEGDFETLSYQEDLLADGDSRLGFVIAQKTNGQYHCLIASEDLVDSIFTRLFFFENSDGGLKHFDMFHKVTDVAGQKIIVWKVDWEGK